MNTVLQIATSVTTPLALAGLCLAFTFYIIREILRRLRIDLIPAGPVVMRVITVFFVLSLTAMLLGSAGWASTWIIEHIRHADARREALRGFADMTTTVRDESYQLLTDYDADFHKLVANGYTPAQAKAKLFQQARSLLDTKCRGDALGSEVRQAFPEYTVDQWKQFFRDMMSGFRRFEEALDASVERGTYDKDQQELEKMRDATIEPLVDRLKELTKLGEFPASQVEVSLSTRSGTVGSKDAHDRG